MRCPAGVSERPGLSTAIPAALPFRLRYTRPSLLDPWLTSEPGVGPCRCMPNVAVLYVMNRPIAVIQATPMDQVSLDRMLSRVRSRMPR